MESAIKKAALTKFGNDNNIEVNIDRESGDIKIQKVLEVVESVEDNAREITLKEEDTAAALKPTLDVMMEGIKTALENTPPELSADLVDMGLILTGGGALLKNIDKLISKETGLPVQIADDPLSCVAVGTGKALEQEELFSTMLSEY